MTRALARLLLLAVIALGAGCQDDLPKATDVTEMRVLGTRISVVGDEERATPEPGERVRISFVTVFPDLDSTTEESQLMIVSCTAPDRFTGGLPICQEIIDAAESGAVDSGSLIAQPRKVACSDIPGRRQTFGGVTVACVNGAPEIELPVPNDFAAESSMFLGVLCEEGEAFFDPNSTTLFGCDDNAGQTIPLHGVYPVQQEPDDRNHNPDASKLSIEMEPFIEWRPIDGTELAEPGALSEECLALASGLTGDAGRPGSDPRLPGVDVGEHQLILRFPAEERERVGTTYESLQITIHTTFGEMERQFTVFTNESETVEVKRGDVPIDSDPPWLEADVAWDPGNDVPASGQLVRFFVTVRDQRGGFNMSTYAACVR